MCDKLISSFFTDICCMTRLRCPRGTDQGLRREPCPGQGAAAPIMSRGGMRVARYERRWGAVGRREKQETGRTPDRARRAGQAGGQLRSGRP
jgi:hypothetical protein